MLRSIEFGAGSFLGAAELLCEIMVTLWLPSLLVALSLSAIYLLR